MIKLVTRMSHVALVLLILFVATPALGKFGFQLSEWEGKPGDIVEVQGSQLLTCCPANIRALAELLLEVDPRRPSTRVVLFDGVVADASGDFVASFIVPDLPEGTYEIEYCARNPESSDQAGYRVCVPAERDFLVLSAGLSSLWWAGGLLLVAGAVVIGLIANARRRKVGFQT